MSLWRSNFFWFLSELHCFNFLSFRFIAVIELTDADHEQNIDVLADATNNGKLCLYKTGTSKIPMMQNNNILPANNNTGPYFENRWRKFSYYLTVVFINNVAEKLHLKMNSSFTYHIYVLFKLNIKLCKNKIVCLQQKKKKKCKKILCKKTATKVKSEEKSSGERWKKCTKIRVGR